MPADADGGSGRVEPHVEVADFLAIAVSVDDPPFMVAWRRDELRFVHRDEGGARTSALTLVGRGAGEAALLYRTLERGGEPPGDPAVEVASGPEPRMREAFVSFAETYFAPSRGVPWLKLALAASTALNAALLLKLLFG